MNLSSKVKTGLDEARMLVLGCDILVGVQFQAAFQQTFQTRPLHMRFANILALLLMIVALGLLIAPSCQYIIAARGKPTRRMAEAITWATSPALFPFASALGLDISMEIEEISGTTIGIIAGAAFAASLVRHRGDRAPDKRQKGAFDGRATK
jgi:hypothetical protein